MGTLYNDTKALSVALILNFLMKKLNRNLAVKNGIQPLKMVLFSQKMKSILVGLRAIPLKGLFGDKLKEKENLFEYLDYYKNETEKLNSLTRSIQPVYRQLSNLQNQLFKKQEELIVSLSGSFDVMVDDGKQQKVWTLIF